MTDYQGIASALAVASVTGALVAIAYYVWYGLALSRLFPRLGAEGWKGWVPILNEIEILVRGGLPGWNVVFSFIPVVQLYGIYLKALAVHRINESFGKGAGYTVLGIFLPPLWATLLASARMPAAGDYDRRVEGLMAPGTAAPDSPHAPGPDALGGGAASAPPAYASAPPPPTRAPVPQAFPSLATGPEPLPRLLAEEPPPIGAPPAAAPPVAAPVAATPVPEAAAAEAPRAEAPPVREEPIAPPSTEPGIVDNPWAAASRVPDPPTAPTPAAPRPADQDDDELDRTVVVDRRPLVPWRLITDDGHVIPLRSRTVLLGRKPVSSTEGVEVVAVPDSTKTLSKNHARLELSEEGAWTVVDLDSTNGVVIIEPDGTESLLPRGGSAPVPGRFMLGKVAMRVAFDDLESTR